MVSMSNLSTAFWVFEDILHIPPCIVAPEPNTTILPTKALANSENTASANSSLSDGIKTCIWKFGLSKRRFSLAS